MAEPAADTGRSGEDAALERYRRLGYTLIAKNWRCRIGELDLVLARGDIVVFCEVKARSGPCFGAGYEAVTARKRAKVRAVAQAFLLSNKIEARDIRFDVASVEIGSRRRPSSESAVELFQDAF